MSIVTKKGDLGKTSLFLGGMVGKHSLRMDACGTLDELCSFLGVVKSLSKNRRLKQTIESIQKGLFVIGTEVTTANRFLKRLKKRINKDDIVRLERKIKDLEGLGIIKKNCFCLPGGSFISSMLDVSRAVARRCERIVVKMKNKGSLKNKYIFIYLNRLSDLLFLLARKHNK